MTLGRSGRGRWGAAPSATPSPRNSSTIPGWGGGFFRSAEAAGIPATVISELRGRLDEHRQATVDSQAANEEWAGSLEAAAGAAADAEEQGKSYTDALSAQFDPIHGVINAQQGLNDALARQAEVYGNAESTAHEKAAADQAVREAVVELDGAAANLNRRIADGSVKGSDARSRFITMATGMGVS